ncbi:MAG: helix-turn-helix domain-containing protein, partial [Clostridia bacterium]|nr:helix-turn-helix domain-containing protein [Clostridia bacterium]
YYIRQFVVMQVFYDKIQYNINMMSIGKRIKDLRLDRNLSQTEFAVRIGTTQDSISLWENDKRLPDTIYIINICKEFNVSADYLLGIVEN